MPLQVCLSARALRTTKVTWDIIGAWIHNGLLLNIVNVPGVTGVANTTLYPTGTVYTAVLTMGLVTYGTSQRTQACLV